MIPLYYEKKTEKLNSKCWHRCLPHKLRPLRIGRFEHGCVICKEEVVPRRDFSSVWILALLRPFYTFEQFQGHSGGVPVDPTLQENVLLPSGHAVFFTALNPMFIEGLRRDEAKNCSVQTHLENTLKQSVLVYFEVAQRKELQFYQTRSKAIILHNTFCGVHRKGGDPEVRRRIVQQNVPISYFTTKNCA